MRDMIRGPLSLLTIVAFLAVAGVGCGKRQTLEESQRKLNNFSQQIKADSSMRQVMNRKWSCTHADSAAAGSLPYRKVSILNESPSQSLQVAVYYSAGPVPTADWLSIDGLDCFYSTAEVRVVKCFSKSDPTLKIESRVTHLVMGQNDPQFDVVSLSVEGAESSFNIYLGGVDNRIGTLADFKKRYGDPFVVRVNSPERCGFED